METGLRRSIGISASLEPSDSSPGQRWIAPLLNLAQGSARRELQSLMREGDLELLGEGLLSLAGRQEQQGREALAAQIYGSLNEARPGELPASIRQRAERRLAALQGHGAIGDRAEVLARHFVQEATDPVTLLAMTVGSLAYSSTRVGLLSRLVAAPSGTLSRGFAARSLASAGAFAVEVPAFWATNKVLRETLQPGSQSWDLASNARELAGLGLSLGALKLVGFGAASAHARAGLRNPLSASLFRQAGMFTGILAGHGLERWAGLRPASDAASTLLDSFVLLLQFNVGGRLSHQLMGSRGSGLSAELETRLQSAIERPPSATHSLADLMHAPLAMAGAGEGGPRRGGEGSPFDRPQISFMEGNGRAPESPARVWKNLLQDVLARGRRPEIEALKNLLGEALRSQSEKSYVAKQLDRWRTMDPEEWKSGIARISEMLETTPAVLGAVEGIEGLRLFANDWNSRPHFTSGNQIVVHVSPGSGNTMALNNFLGEMREALAAKPSLSGLRNFLSPRRSRGDVSLMLERAEPDGTSVYVNWRKSGVKARFNADGHLSGRLEVRQAFREGDSVAEIEALPTPEPRAPKASRSKGRATAVVPASIAPLETNGASSMKAPAGLRSSNYGPRVGENPSQWAMRLLEASQSPDREVSHDIVLEMESRLSDPATAHLARETVERWVSLTSLTAPYQKNGIVARQYQVGPLRSPITIVSLPTTFLPDPWSQVFAEGLASLKRSNSGLMFNRAIEMGSGTGWASIVVAKMGLAREIIATDMNPQASAVGRLNAALNGVSNIRFEQGDLMANLAPDLKADLIIACLPQVRANGAIQGLRAIADYYIAGETYFDRFSLGLIENALIQARGRLEPEGRVLFNLGGRPGRAVLEDLFASQGFRPRLRHSQMIRQDEGTDISSLAAQEASSGQRFEFFRPDNAQESISATEAQGIPNPHHMLYVMEGQPYSELLRRGLERRLTEGGSLGYTHDAGSENPLLRQSLAQEFSREWGFRITPEVVHIGPHADTILEGMLRVLPTENGPVLFGGLGSDLMPSPLEVYAPLRVAPRFAEIEAAVNATNPSVLVLQLPRESYLDREGLTRVLRANGGRRIHTILLEDQPMRMPNAPHPLMEVLANSVPAVEFTHILHSLDRRYAAPALPLAALISANSMLHLNLARYADLTHSRASSLTQDAYTRFFRPAGEEIAASEELPGVLDSVFTDFTPSSSVARALESKSAFESSPRGVEHPDPIAMNFGESEWKPPIRLGNELWEVANTPRPLLESQARQAVVDYLSQSRGVQVQPEQVLLGAGVQPLLVSALRGLREVGGGALQVAVPRPSYGLYFPTVELSGAKLIEYPTRPEGRFLTENGAFTHELVNGGRSKLSAVLINEPSNPAGQFHSPEQLRALARQVQSAKGYLLFDDVFGMLDFGRSRQRRIPSMQILQEALGSRLLTFGGVSKEFAVGGLRFGFAVVGDPNLARAIQAQAAPMPDPLALSVGPELLRHWQPLIQEHRTYLSSRAYQLEQVFRERQLPILEAQGGYSMLANLQFLYGRRMRLRDGGSAVIDHNNLHQLLYQEAGLKIYSDDWARQRGHYRFVFSIDRLGEAVDRLKKFFRSAR